MSITVALFHGDVLFQSGSSEYASLLARAIISKGHTVHLIGKAPSSLKSAVDENVKSFVCPAGSDFFSEANFYHGDELHQRKIVMNRPSSDTKGSCIVHCLVDEDGEEASRSKAMPRKVEFVVNDSDKNDSVDEFTQKSNQRMKDFFVSVLKTHPVDVIHANAITNQLEIALEVSKIASTPCLYIPLSETVASAPPRADAARVPPFLGVRASDFVEMTKYEAAEKLLKYSKSVKIIESTSCNNRTKKWGKSTKREFREKIAALPDFEMDPDKYINELSALVNTKYEERIPDDDIESNITALPWITAPIIVWSGDIQRFSGLHSLIASMPAIRSVHPDSHLVIVGSGPYRPILEALVIALATADANLLEALIHIGEWADVKAFLDDPSHFANAVNAGHSLEAHVHFLGYIDHTVIPSLLSTASVSVYPALTAAFHHTSVLESISAGVLPLVSRVRGLKMTAERLSQHVGLKELKDLMLLPGSGESEVSDRVKVISNRIISILRNDYESISTLSPKLRSVAKRFYDFDVAVPKLVLTYAEALNAF